MLTKACSDNFYGIFFVNGIVAYSVVLACTSFQLPSGRMYLLFCLVCTVGCLLYVALPSDVVVVKPRRTLKEKLLLTSRHMRQLSVYTLLPMWAYHHFVLAYASGVVPQLAPDPPARSLVLLALGIGVCIGSFGSFCIPHSVPRVRVFTVLLLLGSLGILISAIGVCTGGLCLQLCFAAMFLGASWGCLPGAAARCGFVLVLCCCSGFVIVLCCCMKACARSSLYVSGMATQTMNALHPNSKVCTPCFGAHACCVTRLQEESFAAYIFTGSLTQVCVYIGMSTSPFRGIAIAGVTLAIIALACM